MDRDVIKMTEDRARAFDSLYLQHYDRLIRIGCRLLGSRALAEELTQETFLFALLRLDELERHPCPEGWLVVTLNNLIRNENRRASCRDLSLEGVELPAREVEEPLEYVLPKSLPPEDRQLLIWRYEDQMSCGEIADRLGISQTACRSRISRALARCRAEKIFPGPATEGPHDHIEK